MQLRSSQMRFFSQRTFKGKLEWPTNLTTQRASVNTVARIPRSVGSNGRTARPIYRDGGTATLKQHKAQWH